MYTLHVDKGGHHINLREVICAGHQSIVAGGTDGRDVEQPYRAVLMLQMSPRRRGAALPS